MKIVDSVLEVQSFFPEVGSKIAVLVGLTYFVLLAQASIIMWLALCLPILYLFSSFPLLFPNRTKTTYSQCSAFVSEPIMRRANQLRISPTLVAVNKRN